MRSQPLLDQLAIFLASFRVSRRKAVAGGLALAAASTVSSQALTAQEATPEAPSDEPGFGQEFLFVQTFTGGTFAANPEAGTPVAEGRPTAGVHGAYLLSLGGHPGQTVYFSDRPERIVGDVPTDKFVEGMGFGAGNPPNAALVIVNEVGQTVVAVIELINPIVDIDDATVIYEANLLDDYTGAGLGHLLDQQETDEVPPQFGAASLFIDDCPNTDTDCYSEGAPCTLGTKKIAGSGSQGQCWHWSSVSCKVCESRTDWCNDDIGACDGSCSGYASDTCCPGVC